MTDTKVAGGSADGNDGTNGSEPTPEQLAQLAKDKKLASEAAATRVKLREAEAQIKEREKEIEDYKAKLESGTASDSQAKSEVATMKRELDQLRIDNKARAEREKALEDKTRQRTIQSGLATIVAEAKVLEAGSAVALLEKTAKVADDDRVVFTVTDPDTREKIEVEATAENIKKYSLLPKIYFPAEGAAGSGARGGREGAKLINGIDMERALSDNSYYRANRDKIQAIRAQQRPQ
jgi:hypothetical protein